MLLFVFVVCFCFFLLFVVCCCLLGLQGLGIAMAGFPRIPRSNTVVVAAVVVAAVVVVAFVVSLCLICLF